MMGDNKQKDLSSDDALERFRRNVENRQGPRSDPPCRTTAELLDLLRNLKNQDSGLDSGLEVRNSALQRAQQALGALYQQFEDLYERAPCGYLTLDPNGLITRINSAGATLLKGSRENILHTAFSRYIPPSRKNRYHHALRKAVHSNQKQCMELHRFGADGTGMWLWAEIVADSDKAGNLRQWRMTLVDISSKKKAEIALKASEQKYRMLYDEMVAGAVIVADVQRDHQGRINDGRIEQVNVAFERLMGVPRDRLVGSSLRRIWSLDDAFRFDQSDGSMHGYHRIHFKREHPQAEAHLLVGTFPLDENRFGMTLIDISTQKQIETSMEKARKDLEIKARESTSEIQQINLALRQEVEARKVTQRALLEKSQELEAYSLRLKEANMALKVLLRERDSERRELEERVVCNINELIRPHLLKLCEGDLSQRRKALINAISSGLDDITSPLSKRFLIESARLTPVENQVAGLIRQGRTTKEISKLVGVAPSTVDFHRFNIRRKLNLTNKRTNLQSYLRSLT